MMQIKGHGITEFVTQDRLSFGQEPVTLIGSPRRCTGLVRLHNPHAQRVKLRRLRLMCSDAALTNTPSPSVLELRVSAALDGGETRQLEVQAVLPKGTPPGSYDARIESMDGAPLPVLIHVLEDRRLRLLPGVSTHTGSPGETFTVRATASNEGNVPLVIPAGVPLQLYAADQDWHAHFHAAVKTHGAQGHGPFLDAFVKSLGADEPALGRAKVLVGTGVLLPQQSRVLELAITVPKKLRAGRQYRGLLRIAGAQLGIMLHVSTEDETISTAG